MAYAIESSTLLRVSCRSGRKTCMFAILYRGDVKVIRN